MTILESRSASPPPAGVEELPALRPEPSRPSSGRRRGVAEGLLAIGVVAAIVAGVFAVGRAVPTTTATTPTAPLLTPAQVASVAADQHAATDDRGYSALENGVQHNHAFEQPLDPLTRAVLAHQLSLSREVALQYPTLADAERAGLHHAGAFSPGLGTHMIAFGNYGYGAGDSVMNDDQIRHPLAWIYDGTKPDSPVAGLFYSGVVADPAGFAGPNDVWHQHSNICLTQAADGGVDAPLGADNDATKAQCDAVGGNLVATTGALLHVWTVPGYEDSQGVFAHLNPAVTCTDGTYYTIDPATIGTAATTCRDGSE